MSKKVAVRTAIMVLAIGALAVGMAVRTPGIARAYTPSLNCGPTMSLANDVYNHCAYGYQNSSGNWVATPGYSLPNDDLVYVFVYFDPYNPYSGQNVPSNIISDEQAAVNNWNNSGAHLVLTPVNSMTDPNTGQQYTNLIHIYLSTSGFNNDPFSGNGCPTTWGYGWYRDWSSGYSSHYHEVTLNAYYLVPGTPCINYNSGNGWTGVFAHEMGHDMGLYHNYYTDSNGTTMLMHPDPVKVANPQDGDLSIFNAMYPYYRAGCLQAPSNMNCDNTDYIQDGCNHYAQSGGYSNPYITVTLEYSTNCQSNFTWATATSGYFLTKVTIQRQANYLYPGYTLTDTPGTSSWYTNNIWSPDNKAQACAWYAANNGYRVYGPYCTAWV